jgi:hypothetical protein
VTEDPFGTRLRRERERRRIALSSVSANTNIRVSFFEALERGDLSAWPDGTFRRDGVRAYAASIGLDPDVVLREFLEQRPDAPELLLMGEAPAPRTPASTPPPVDTVFRLTLAEARAPFVRGRVLADMRRRWSAVACDAGVVLAIGGTLFVACDQFWPPLAVATLGYYLGGILLLGNTPGVCLLAPAVTRDEDMPSVADLIRAAITKFR